MIGFCFFEKVFSNGDDFWEIKVIPLGFGMGYSGASCAESTAEFYDGSGGMFFEKGGAILVKFSCS